jgi:hypothetical protein
MGFIGRFFSDWHLGCIFGGGNKGWKLPAHTLSCSKEERVENYFYFLMLRIREYFWYGSADSYRVPLTNGSDSGSGFPAYKKIMMEACAVIPVPYRCNNFFYLLHAPIRAMFNEFSAIPFSVYLNYAYVQRCLSGFQ